jgi:hypothetical protein
MALSLPLRWEGRFYYRKIYVTRFQDEGLHPLIEGQNCIQTMSHHVMQRIIRLKAFGV